MRASLPPITPVSPRVIKSRLQNGSWVTCTEVPDPEFTLRYDVSLDGGHLGSLVLLVAPLSGERLWLTSTNDRDWSPPVYSEREAVRFLLPLELSC